MSPGGSQIPKVLGQFREKICYGSKNPFSSLRECSRRAESLPSMFLWKIYAAVDPTTPPELGDTAVWRYSGYKRRNIFRFLYFLTKSLLDLTIQYRFSLYRKFYGKSILTFGVLGVIRSYLVIILHILCVFGKIKIFDVKIFFRRKISDFNQKLPLSGFYN